MIIQNIPPAMLIEMGREMLSKLDDDTRKDQEKELHVAVGDKPQDFINGYNLGLETARAMLAMRGQKL
jgi:hypothetical protein